MTEEWPTLCELLSDPVEEGIALMNYALMESSHREKHLLQTGLDGSSGPPVDRGVPWELTELAQALDDYHLPCFVKRCALRRPRQ